MLIILTDTSTDGIERSLLVNSMEIKYCRPSVTPNGPRTAVIMNGMRLNQHQDPAETVLWVLESVQEIQRLSIEKAPVKRKNARRT